MSTYTVFGNYVPDGFESYFREIGKYLASYNFILRTNTMKGLNTLFLNGCVMGGGKREIYLPWAGFNGIPVTEAEPFLKDAVDIAMYNTVNWDNLSSGIQKITTTYVPMLLGSELDDTVDFVILSTKYGQITQEIQTVMNLCKLHNIATLNVGESINLLEFKYTLKKFLEPKIPSELAT